MNDPLDLKYRPRKFADVVGNASVVKLLLTRSRQGTLAGRSMMFGGPKGCGKTSLARIAACAIVCDDLRDGEPCCECESCQSVIISSSESFDEYDAATQGTVDRVRGIIDDLEYGSINGKPRVIVLDEAHRLSKASQDALLKAMEDRRLVVVLCTTEPRKIVEAIRSRVEEYPVSAPSEDVMVNLMSRICVTEKIAFEDGALRITARSYDNCPRECICAIDTLIAAGGVTTENAKQLFKYDRMQLVVDALHLIDIDMPRAFSILDELSAEGGTWIRDTMIAALTAAVRQNVGAKSTFPVPIGFFAHRGSEWTKLAHMLGMIDKPTLSDVEAALVATAVTVPPSMIASPPPISAASSIPTPASPSSTPTIIASPAPSPTPIVIPLPAPVPVISQPPPPRIPPRSLELDGIRFSPDESLTSLDSKMERSSGPPSAPEGLTLKVEYDKRNAPLTEKEFATGLVRRVKGS